MMVKYQPPKRVAERARAIATIPLIIRDQGIEILGTGYWVMGIGLLGIGLLGIWKTFSQSLAPSPQSLIQFLTTEDKNGINGGKGLRKATRL
jgi:hypothetical protein